METKVDSTINNIIKIPPTKINASNSVNSFLFFDLSLILGTFGLALISLFIFLNFEIQKMIKDKAIKIAIINAGKFVVCVIV